MSSSSGSDEFDSVLHADLRNILDFQADEHRHLEKQATLLFRVIIAFFGLSVTGGVVVLRMELNGTIDLYSKPVTVPDFTRVLPIWESASNTIALILFLSAVFWLSSFTNNLIIHSPRHAFNIFHQTDIGCDYLDSIEHFEDNEMRRKQMQSTIASNRSNLRQARESWDNCIESLQTGLLDLLKGGSTFIFLVVTPSEYALLAIFAILLYELSQGLFSRKEYVREYFKPIPSYDSLYALESVILYIIFSIQDETLQNDPLIGLLIFISFIVSFFLSQHYLQSAEHAEFLVRRFGVLFITIFVSVMFILIVLPSQIGLRYATLVGNIIGSVLIASIVILIPPMFSVTADYLRQKVQQSSTLSQIVEWIWGGTDLPNQRNEM